MPTAEAARRAQAIAELRAAERAAEEAWTRLEASPETLEYQIEWGIARREEAAAAGRLKRACDAHDAARDG